MKERLNPKVFKIDRNLMVQGYYSDKYFVREQQILKSLDEHPKVIAQIFCRKDAIVGGLDEAIAILKECTNFYKLVVRALYDGDTIKPWENVIEIEGDLSLFCNLETVLLGVIARPTAIATAVSKLVKATDKPILFFASRFDHYRVQATDGYAAKLVGVNGVSSDAGADYWGDWGVGTIPHSLIAAFNGNTVEAALAFDKVIHSNIKRIVLVDWDNDCVGTTIKVVEAFEKASKLVPDLLTFIGEGKGKIWGVRFDTSSSLRDKCVSPQEGNFGVCPELVCKARKEFDSRGWTDLKIIVSGGFNPEKINLFEKLDVPVDAYGVGSYVFDKKIDFTMDIVINNGKHCAKVGRKYIPNPRLEVVK